jgi:hypothetical protein
MPRQDSVTDQLWDLVDLANKNGMYDAADWLAAHIPHPPNVSRREYCINHGHIRLSVDVDICRNHLNTDDRCVFVLAPEPEEDLTCDCGCGTVSI